MKHPMYSMSACIHLNAGVGNFPSKDLQEPIIEAEYHKGDSSPYIALTLGNSCVFMTPEQAVKIAAVLTTTGIKRDLPQRV